MNGDLAYELFAEFLTAARRAEREAILAEKEALVANSGGLIGPSIPPRYRRVTFCPGCSELCGQCS